MTLSLVMGLISQGPAMLDFVTKTYALWTSNAITADDLQKMWEAAGAAVKEAEQKWSGSGTQTAGKVVTT